MTTSPLTHEIHHTMSPTTRAQAQPQSATKYDLTRLHLNNSCRTHEGRARPPTLPQSRAKIDTEFARIINELVRRGFIGGVAGTAALLGLAGRGNNSAGFEGTSRGSGPAARVVDTVKGKVTVPAHPKRVVAISPDTMTTLWDLGVNVAGVYDEGVQSLDSLKSADVARIQQIKSTYSSALARFTWDVIKGQSADSGWGLYGKGDSQITDILLSLDISLGHASATVTGEEKDESLEEIPLLSDAGVIGYWKGATPTSFLTNRLFTDLTAVRSGRAFPIINFAPTAYGERQSTFDEITAILRELQ